MFDTSVVRPRAIAAPRSTLLISIVFHSVAILAALTMTVASTEVPAQPPRQLELYRPVELPPGPPPAPAPPQPVQQQHESIPQRPQTILAPTIIPDQIVPVPQATTTSVSVPGSVDDGGGGSPDGIPGGVGDAPGGGGEATSTAPYTPGIGDVIAARVIHRVEPRFPPALIHAVRNATVVVHCVIGKDGSIHDPQIVMSSFPPFNDSVLAAVRQWKFAPGTMHGQPVDTYFELTVKFEVLR